jgi:hypothetical protein
MRIKIRLADADRGTLGRCRHLCRTYIRAPA